MQFLGRQVRSYWWEGKCPQDEQKVLCFELFEWRDFARILVFDEQASKGANEISLHLSWISEVQGTDRVVFQGIFLFS